MNKKKKSEEDNINRRHLIFYLKEGEKLIEKLLSEDSEERLRLALEPDENVINLIAIKRVMGMEPLPSNFYLK